MIGLFRGPRRMMPRRYKDRQIHQSLIGTIPNGDITRWKADHPRLDAYVRIVFPPTHNVPVINSYDLIDNQFVSPNNIPHHFSCQSPYDPLATGRIPSPLWTYTFTESLRYSSSCVRYHPSAILSIPNSMPPCVSPQNAALTRDYSSVTVVAPVPRRVLSASIASTLISAPLPNPTTVFYPTIASAPAPVNFTNLTS